MEPIGVGNYFTQPNGGGTPLSAGTAITTTQTLYIYTVDGSCTDESSFTITIDTPVVAPVLDPVTACDSFTLDALPSGNYFTAPNGGGDMLEFDAEITETTTLYIYVENGTCNDQSTFDITINYTPWVDVLDPVSVYERYELEALAVGDYYTKPNGGGTLLNAGDIIESSQTLYVYAEANGCSDESSFDITINVIELSTRYGISPDGDNNNETWQIVDIEHYPDNEVTIYNRWGDMVYHTKHYNNTTHVFSGTANKLTNLGADILPEGTYFFTIDIFNSKNVGTTKGFIVLKR